MAFLSRWCLGSQVNCSYERLKELKLMSTIDASDKITRRLVLSSCSAFWFQIICNFIGRKTSKVSFQRYREMKTSFRETFSPKRLVEFLLISCYLERPRSCSAFRRCHSSMLMRYIASTLDGTHHPMILIATMPYKNLGNVVSILKHSSWDLFLFLYHSSSISSKTCEVDPIVSEGFPSLSALKINWNVFYQIEEDQK